MVFFRQVVLLALATSSACKGNGTPRKSGSPTTVAARISYTFLKEFEAATGCRMYADLLKAMRNTDCRQKSCEHLIQPPDQACLAIPNDARPSDAALVLLRSADEHWRELGLELACSICLVNKGECRCDGDSCRPEDIVGRGSSVSGRLECGSYIVDGKRFKWGNEVKRLTFSILESERDL
jgi:hypothetical protein